MPAEGGAPGVHHLRPNRLRKDVTETRDYTYDETLVLGKAHEEAVLREAIAKDLVRIVLKQVSSL